MDEEYNMLYGTAANTIEGDCSSGSAPLPKTTKKRSSKKKAEKDSKEARVIKVQVEDAGGVDNTNLILTTYDNIDKIKEKIGTETRENRKKVYMLQLATLRAKLTKLEKQMEADLREDLDTENIAVDSEEEENNATNGSATRSANDEVSGSSSSDSEIDD